MFQGVTQQQGTKNERKLCRLYQTLNEAERQTLMEFAEFLHAKSENKTMELTKPLLIPRPEKESVIAAVKRLSKTYPMLEKSKLFNTTSTLMTAHIMHGKKALDVINELEKLFVQEYQLLLVNQTK